MTKNQEGLFDDEKISGLQPHKKSFAKYKVLDWVNVHSGMIHEYDFLNSSIDFVRDIHFYPSNRIDGRHDKKDLVAVSYLSEDQLKDFDFSDTVAKFKILKLMKQAGIRGARNGRDQLNPNKYKYYSLKARTTKREIMKGKMPKYENEENIIFDYQYPYRYLLYLQQYKLKMCHHYFHINLYIHLKHNSL